MSGTALPLPLALSEPVAMSSDPEDVLAASLGVGLTAYNPETQMGTHKFDGFNIQLTVNNSQCGVWSNQSMVFQIDDWYQVDDLN